MKKHEFFQKYANLPIDKRTPEIMEIYRKIKELSDEMRPNEIKMDRLLDKTNKNL